VTLAAVVLAVPARPARPSSRLATRGAGASARQRSRPLAAVADAAAQAGLDEVIVVVGDESAAAGLPEHATVLLDEAVDRSECSALRAALDWCGRNGHSAVLVAPCPVTGSPPAPLTDAATWKGLASASGGPVVLLGGRSGASAPVRIDAAAWPLLPLNGDLAGLWRSRPELVTRSDPPTSPPPSRPSAAPLALARAQRSRPGPAGEPSAADVAAVSALLGRPPACAFTVAVRAGSGAPVVIENAPLLDDGTPMPTRWWLVGRAEREAVSRLESAGGARAAEAALPAEEIAAAHARYAAGRDALLPAGHAGPVPSGGVGGTRQGVKCLHAHLAAYLAGTGDPVGRWTTRRLAGQLDGAVAAVDCGTNSTRLLVAGPDGSQLERLMTITRLGEGVDESKRLSSAAIERTLAALREYRQVMDRHGVVRLRATATSAARDAVNAAALMEPAGEVLGTPLEVLSSAEEGTLSFSGATAGLDPAGGPYLVVDLGGGSTELITTRQVDPSEAGGEPGRPACKGEDGLVVASIDAGCVRMTERFLRHDPPRAEEVAAARSAVAGLVARAVSAEPALAAPARLVGVAGTVTSLGALALGLASYDPARTHHSVLGRGEVEGLLDELAALSAVQRRRRRPPLEPGRADVIVGGAAVLAAVMAGLGHESLIVSETDSLDGLVDSLHAV
jgi:exopolyphosphatase/guanosine-5'-triphosphate,3'-diphosphate pyrophosphatase